MILAFTLVLMPMVALASDSASGDPVLQRDLNLKSFDFEPKYVKIDGSDQTVNFLANIYAKNGLMANKSIGLATQAIFLGPHSFWNPFYRDRMNITFMPPPIPGGEMKNGTYKGNGTFEKKIKLLSGIKEGVWQLDSIKLVDSNGLVRELNGDNLGSPTKELYVEVRFERWLVNLLLIPIIFFGILFAIYWQARKKFKNLKYISWAWKGYDGATSSSKFQFTLWTSVVLYAYIITVIDSYFNHGNFNLGLTFPQNLMLAMGLSATTALAAKGITSAYAAKQVDKSDTSKGGLFFDDDGYPDLAKIQLIAWTFIGIGIFLLKTLNDVMGSTGVSTGLPDIDTTVLTLMGIGQGAYVGKKIITKDDPDAPDLDSINPKEGDLDQLITISGANFGKGDPKIVTIDTNKVQFKKDANGKDMVNWEDSKVTFHLRNIDSISGKSLAEVLKEGRSVNIGVIIGNKSSVSDQTFTIKKKTQ
jgi:hypothetical protein